MRYLFFLVLFCVLPYTASNATADGPAEEIPLSRDTALIYRADAVAPSTTPQTP